MIFIAVCDDDQDICDLVEDHLHKYSKDAAVSLEIESYGTCEELYKAINEKNKFDVIFLDIEFENMNGIQLAEKIRDEQNDEDVKIVYISAMESYAMELFKTRPFDFLIKPIKYDKIFKIMGKIIKLTREYKKTYVFKTGHAMNRVSIDDIIYVEARGRKAGIFTSGGEYEFYGKLSDIKKSLGETEFAFAHKSYLINLTHVIEYGYNKVKLSDRKILSVSQTYRKKIREQLLLLRKEDEKK